MLHVQWKLLIKGNIDRNVAGFISVVQKLLNFFTQYCEVSDKEIFLKASHLLVVSTLLCQAAGAWSHLNTEGGGVKTK